MCPFKEGQGTPGGCRGWQGWGMGVAEKSGETRCDYTLLSASLSHDSHPCRKERINTGDTKTKMPTAGRRPPSLFLPFGSPTVAHLPTASKFW